LVIPEPAIKKPEALLPGNYAHIVIEPPDILGYVDLVLSRPPDWNPPAEYLVKNMSQTVIKILTGFRLS
jgi:hypothetical protein